MLEVCVSFGGRQEIVEFSVKAEAQPDASHCSYCLRFATVRERLPALRLA
jgi:hypothetical protein